MLSQKYNMFFKSIDSPSDSSEFSSKKEYKRFKQAITI